MTQDPGVLDSVLELGSVDSRSWRFANQEGIRDGRIDPVARVVMPRARVRAGAMTAENDQARLPQPKDVQNFIDAKILCRIVWRRGSPRHRPWQPVTVEEKVPLLRSRFQYFDGAIEIESQVGGDRVRNHQDDHSRGHRGAGGPAPIRGYGTEFFRGVGIQPDEFTPDGRWLSRWGPKPVARCHPRATVSVRDERIANRSDCARGTGNLGEGGRRARRIRRHLRSASRRRRGMR